MQYRLIFDYRYQSSLSDETGLAQMMTKRDRHIVELEYCLATSNEEKAILAQQNRSVSWCKIICFGGVVVKVASWYMREADTHFDLVNMIESNPLY